MEKGEGDHRAGGFGGVREGGQLLVGDHGWVGSQQVPGGPLGSGASQAGVSAAAGETVFQRLQAAPFHQPESELQGVAEADQQQQVRHVAMRSARHGEKDAGARHGEGREQPPLGQRLVGKRPEPPGKRLEEGDPQQEEEPDRGARHRQPSPPRIGQQPRRTAARPTLAGPSTTGRGERSRGAGRRRRGRRFRGSTRPGVGRGA